MRQIADDPIIRCMERTGYPPWMDDFEEEPEDDEGDYRDADALLEFS